MAQIDDIEKMEHEMGQEEIDEQKLTSIRIRISRLKTLARSVPVAPVTVIVAVMMFRGSLSISELPNVYKALFVVVIGTMTLFKFSIDGAIRDLQDDKGIILARRRVQEQLPTSDGEATQTTEQNYFDRLVKINVENLSAYYELVKIQTDKSFRASLTIAYFGAGLIILALALGFYRTDATDKVTYIATGAGVLTEFIAGVFFWLYSRTVSQLRGYHDSLISVQNILLSFKLVSDTRDPKEKSAMVSQMCSFLLEGVAGNLPKRLTDKKEPALKSGKPADKAKSASADDDSK
jgi:hypothetical protein